jgi:uncharacterized membrane protein YccF (DUF307 family)
MTDASLEDVVEQLQENQEEMEKIEKETKTRSVLNPLYWIGVFLITVGILCCLTLIGIPLGWPLITTGKKCMFKNPPSI